MAAHHPAAQRLGAVVATTALVIGSISLPASAQPVEPAAPTAPATPVR